MRKGKVSNNLGKYFSDIIYILHVMREELSIAMKETVMDGSTLIGRRTTED